VLVAGKPAGITTVRELVAAAKLKPGELKFGSTGPGTLRTAAARQRPTRRRRRVVELGLSVCREFELQRRTGRPDEGFSGKEN